MNSQKKIYLIDTSFLLAYQNKDNKRLMSDCRTTVDILREEEYPRFMITNMVFCEYSNNIWGILGRKHRKTAIEKITEIAESFEVEFIDSNIFKRAYELFLRKNAEGYNWSFVDCTSFVFIKERQRKMYGDKRLNIRHALTIDGHFEEAQKEFGFLVTKL